MTSRWSTAPKVSVEVSPRGFLGYTRWVPLGTKALPEIAISRGRQKPFDRFEPGTCSVAFDNRDRSLAPFSPAENPPAYPSWSGTYFDLATSQVRVRAYGTATKNWAYHYGFDGGFEKAPGSSTAHANGDPAPWNVLSIESRYIGALLSTGAQPAMTISTTRKRSGNTSLKVVAPTFESGREILVSVLVPGWNLLEQQACVSAYVYIESATTAGLEASLVLYEGANFQSTTAATTTKGAWTRIHAGFTMSSTIPRISPVFDHWYVWGHGSKSGRRDIAPGLIEIVFVIKKDVWTTGDTIYIDDIQVETGATTPSTFVTTAPDTVDLFTGRLSPGVQYEYPQALERQRAVVTCADNLSFMGEGTVYGNDTEGIFRHYGYLLEPLYTQRFAHFPLSGGSDTAFESTLDPRQSSTDWVDLSPGVFTLRRSGVPPSEALAYDQEIGRGKTGVKLWPSSYTTGYYLYGSTVTGPENLDIFTAVSFAFRTTTPGRTLISWGWIDGVHTGRVYITSDGYLATETALSTSERQIFSIRVSDDRPHFIFVAPFDNGVAIDGTWLTPTYPMTSSYTDGFQPSGVTLGARWYSVDRNVFKGTLGLVSFWTGASSYDPTILPVKKDHVARMTADILPLIRDQSPVTTGAAVARIARTSAFIDEGRRIHIDSGEALTLVPDSSPLDAINEIAVGTEGGQVFVDGAGGLVFQGRNRRQGVAKTLESMARDGAWTLTVNSGTATKVDVPPWTDPDSQYVGIDLGASSSATLHRDYAVTPGDWIHAPIQSISTGSATLSFRTSGGSTISSWTAPSDGNDPGSLNRSLWLQVPATAANFRVLFSASGSSITATLTIQVRSYPAASVTVIEPDELAALPVLSYQDDLAREVGSIVQATGAGVSRTLEAQSVFIVPTRAYGGTVGTASPDDAGAVEMGGHLLRQSWPVREKINEVSVDLLQTQRWDLLDLDISSPLLLPGLTQSGWERDLPAAFYVEGVSHDIAPDRWLLTLRLSLMDPYEGPRIAQAYDTSGMRLSL